MGSTVWVITILKERPWIGIVVGIILFFILFVLKRWFVRKLMIDEKEG